MDLCNALREMVVELMPHENLSECDFLLVDPIVPDPFEGERIVIDIWQ